MMIMIRKQVFIVLVLLGAIMSYAQDVIVKKSGEVLNVYNVEIASEYVFYTVDQAGEDIKRINKEEVFSVKVGDGEMRMIGENAKAESKKQETVDNSAPTNEGLIERKVADNNAELIARYNKRHEGYTDKEPTEKVAKDGYAILGVTKESVLSNEDIEVELRMKNFDEWCSVSNYEKDLIILDKMFNINIINKTNKVVYIDLGNTFRIFNSGNAKVYYDGSSVSQSSGSGSGASLGLGAVTGALGIGGVAGTLASGVSVGGGTQSSASKTYGSQRVLAVPPMGKVALPPAYEVIGKKVEEIYDNLWFTYPEKYKGMIRKNAITDFTEEETLWKNQFMITYSLDSKFKKYATIKFGMYIKQTIGKRGAFGEQVSVKELSEKLKKYDENTLIGYIIMDKKAKSVMDVKNVIVDWLGRFSDYNYY